MKTTIFYGNQKKGNTYITAQIVKDEMGKCGDVEFTEFFMPRDLPEICSGCQLCLGNPWENCPHARYVRPILEAILASDAVIFATAHAGASAMPASMKNLLDHLDFLVLPVAPREEIFTKKALVVTTGTGSAGAAREISDGIRHWGMNRVHTVALRMFTDKWGSMPQAKQNRFEEKLRRAAKRLYAQKRGRPYPGTIALYHMSKFILKRYAGAGTYPYRYWQERGWFRKCPF